MTKELKNWKQTMITKYGSEEALKRHLREIASKGGKKSTGFVGFATLPPEMRVELGRKGGKSSRKAKGVNTQS